MGARDDDATLAGSLALGDTQAKHERRPAAAVLGTTLGRHLLLSELGAGAMGVVFAAYDPQLDRKIAIKLVRGHADLDARTRMQREAQALAKLGHPNVVAVYDVGVHDEQLFIAMEFVEGQTLRAWMDGAPALTTGSRPHPRASTHAPVRPWREVLDVFQQAGRGLAAAHAAGLVHRDFKPDNVMLSEDGRVRVMDFGLARVDDDPIGLQRSGDTAIGTLTQTGAILGTPAYMSLEQFGGGTVDARSDQFSFCVALHEALYGQRPFVAQTLGELTGKLIAGAASPPPARTSVPGWIHAVLVRGLASEPTQRFASMDELLHALANDPIARRRRIALRLAIGFGLGLGVGLAVALRDEVEERDAVIEERDAVIEEQASELELKNAALERQVAEQTQLLSIQRGLRASVLIDGHNEAEALLLGVQAVGAYADAWADAPREAVMGLEQVLAHDTVNLQASHVLQGHTHYLTSSVYSPDGTRLATSSLDGSVRVWDVQGAALRHTFASEAEVLSLVFSPDGARLAAASSDSTIWDVARGVALVELEGRLHTLAFSPDGTLLAGASFDGRAHVWSAETGALRWTLGAPNDPLVRDLAFTPDGARVVFASGAEPCIVDVASGTLVATLRGHEAPIISLAIAPDGSQLATASEDHRARLWTPAGEPLAVLEGHTDRVGEIAYTPDGRRVVTVSWDGTGQVFDAASGRRIASLAGGHEAGIVSIAVSPTDASVATGSFDGNVAIWDTETGALRARLRGHRADVWNLAFAPDGRQLATASVDHTARLWDIEHAWVVALEGPENDAIAFAYSPDETQLATLSRAGLLRLWASETGELLRTLAPGEGTPNSNLAYSPDGRRLALTTRDAVQVWDTQTGALAWSMPARQANVMFSPAGTLLGVFDERSIQIYDANDYAPLTSFERGDLVIRESFAPDDSRLAIANAIAPVQLWDPRSGARLGQLGTQADAIANVIDSPDGRELATSGATAIRTWDASTLDARLTLPDSEGVVSCAYSPNGRRIAAVRGSDGVWVWDSSSGELVVHIEPESHDTGTGVVAFTPDGTHVVLASSGVRIYDVEQGEPIMTIDSLLAGPHHVSRDGTRLTIVDTEAHLQIWDIAARELATRERIGTPRPDGSIAWPIPPRDLVRIGCTRLRVFTHAYPAARDICDPLADE